MGRVAKPWGVESVWTEEKSVPMGRGHDSLDSAQKPKKSDLMGKRDENRYARKTFDLETVAIGIGADRTALGVFK